MRSYDSRWSQQLTRTPGENVGVQLPFGESLREEIRKQVIRSSGFTLCCRGSEKDRLWLRRPNFENFIFQFAESVEKGQQPSISLEPLRVRLSFKYT